MRRKLLEFDARKLFIVLFQGSPIGIAAIGVEESSLTIENDFREPVISQEMKMPGQAGGTNVRETFENYQILSLTLNPDK